MQSLNFRLKVIIRRLSLEWKMRGIRHCGYRKNKKRTKDNRITCETMNVSFEY